MNNHSCYSLQAAYGFIYLFDIQVSFLERWFKMPKGQRVPPPILCPSAAHFPPRHQFLMFPSRET